MKIDNMREQFERKAKAAKNAAKNKAANNAQVFEYKELTPTCPTVL
jgi:23S rRNA maturation mini-RNase III